MWTGQSDSEKQWTLVDFSFCCFSRADNQKDSWICESLNFHLTRRMNKHQFLSNQQTCSWFQRVCGNQCEWLVRQSLLYKENKPNLNRQQHHPLCTRFFFLLPSPSPPPPSLFFFYFWESLERWVRHRAAQKISVCSQSDHILFSSSFGRKLLLLLSLAEQLLHI